MSGGMSGATTRGRRRTGMTLIELVVGLVITGMVTAAGYGAFASIVDHRDAVRRATVEVERAAALRETLVGWFRGGQVLVQRGGAPRFGSGGGGAVPDEVIVSTTAPGPADAPTTLLRLFVDDDPDTPERGLTVQFQPSVQDSLQTRELEPRVTGLRIEYLDARTRRWIPASEVATIQPRAIRLALSGESGADSLPALLRLPLVHAMGAPGGRAVPAAGGQP
jgi:prepilin-type N-terminal cleavage/methylation domain-containing protein